MYSPEAIQGLQDLLVVSSQAEVASSRPTLSLQADLGYVLYSLPLSPPSPPVPKGDARLTVSWYGELHHNTAVTKVLWLLF